MSIAHITAEKKPEISEPVIGLWVSGSARFVGLAMRNSLDWQRLEPIPKSENYIWRICDPPDMWMPDVFSVRS